ncbi:MULTISPECIES: hypothetical protein [Pseudoalteromonas]|uniref:hypothetical protein n=1 Tax=Pseudoalteromonas TaxID=53246 RepID=UPI0019CFF0C4|nr:MULTISPECIES: hypothetical protein [Pseudoalteromonas]MBR8842759.1 hypothetical protein [Pseudoalteromonas sp. JC3]UDM62093.1 hypothetical protein KIJ96_02205 [Pseudoalteromonas piscicida]WJE10231.1 hypothetical protein QSH61_07130 [Pseudoalteromonas sp. JC3]
MWQSAEFLDFDIYVTRKNITTLPTEANKQSKNCICIWLDTTTQYHNKVQSCSVFLASETLKNSKLIAALNAVRDNVRVELSQYNLPTPAQSELIALFELLTTRSKIVGRYRTTLYYPFEFDAGKVSAEICVTPNQALAFKVDAIGATGPEVDKLDKEQIQRQELYSQNYLYYSSRVRKRFFSLQNEHCTEVKCFHEFQLATTNVAMGLKGNKSRPTLNANIERLSLIQHGLNQQSYLLSITLKPKVEDALNAYAKQRKLTQDTWFWLFIEACNNRHLLALLQQAQVAYWLQFSEQVRILYPTFIEQKEENKISEVLLQLGDTAYKTHVDGRTVENSKETEHELQLFPENIEQPVSEHILRLVSLFFIDKVDTQAIIAAQTEQNAIIEQLKVQCTSQYDSRLYVNACYVLLGKYPSTSYGREQLDQLTMLATQVDSFETLNRHQDGGYAYHREFLQKLADVQWYTRWKNTTAISGFNEYAAVSVGFGGFYQNIGYRHWTHNYHYMVAYAALTREVLQSLIRQMELATLHMTETHLDEKPLSQYRGIRRNFINFMNQYWFDAVSHEQQGLEVFEHIKRAFSLDNHFDKVKDKIAWADDYMESWRNTYFVDKADKTSMAALIFAAIAIITAFPVLGAFDNYNIVERFAFGLLLVASPFILTNYLVVRNTKVLLNKVAARYAVFRHRHFSSFAKLTTSFAVVVLALALLL